MLAYILRRVLLMIPTLFGIMVLNFVVIQFAPGGPIEQIIAEIQGTAVGATARIGGSGTGDTGGGSSSSSLGSESAYRGAQGLDPEFIKELEVQFGFDKPAYERFFLMMKNYLMFDFGTSYFRDESVVNLVIEKLPVSISIGLWTTLLVYLISIPLGIAKAVRDGTKFDIWTSSLVIVGNAIPSFLFAVALIVLFAGGSYFNWFPLRGLTSDNWEQLSTFGKVTDYLWHIALPVTALVIGAVFGVGFFREWDTERRARKLRESLRDEKIHPDSNLPATELDQSENRPKKLVRRSQLMTIVAAWVITVPSAALLSAGIFLTVSYFAE